MRFMISSKEVVMRGISHNSKEKKKSRKMIGDVKMQTIKRRTGRSLTGDQPLFLALIEYRESCRRTHFFFFFGGGGAVGLGRRWLDFRDTAGTNLGLGRNDGFEKSQCWKSAFKDENQLKIKKISLIFQKKFIFWLLFNTFRRFHPNFIIHKHIF